MKFHTILCILLLLSLILSPIAALQLSRGEGEGAAKTDDPKPTAASSPADLPDTESIKVLSHNTGSVAEIDMEEYLVGAVAAEMPAAYHEQALRAQAVCCYTYALYMKQQQAASPSKALDGAHISDESATHQGYIPQKARREKWGDKFESYESKIQEAVQEVAGFYITCEGSVILAAFHAISAGQTNDAKSVWGKDYAYLQRVLSAGDKLSPEHTVSVVFTPDQLRKTLQGTDGVTLADDPAKWLGEGSATETGLVTAQVIGGKTFTGMQLRTLLELRSPSFTIDYTDGGFHVKTRGYGHGVGMSQYGADYMARQGSSWQEILKRYYTGVEIQEG